MWTKKRISANAYRPSDAITAVKMECRKWGIKARNFDFERATEQLPDDKVAIVVTRTSDRSMVPASSRRTVYVTFEAERGE